MEIRIPSDARLFIIEGIPGSGKNTLQERLRERLKDKLIYEFDEEALLFSWKHAWLSHIGDMRLAFYESFLDYCEQVLLEDPEAVFVLNRFHISYKLLTVEPGDIQRYEHIVERLSVLPTFVFVPIIDDSLIEARSIHKERIDPVWQKHLKKRLAFTGYSTLTEMYSEEQRNILSLLKQQGIPFETLEI